MKGALVTIAAFAVATCIGVITTAAPALRLVWVATNLVGCGAVISKLKAPVETFTDAEKGAAPDACEEIVSVTE